MCCDVQAHVGLSMRCCAALCRRGDADDALAAAKESGNAEDIEKYSKRSVKVGMALEFY